MWGIVMVKVISVLLVKMLLVHEGPMRVFSHLFPIKPKIKIPCSAILYSDYKTARILVASFYPV